MDGRWVVPVDWALSVFSLTSGVVIPTVADVSGQLTEEQSRWPYQTLVGLVC